MLGWMIGDHDRYVNVFGAYIVAISLANNSEFLKKERSLKVSRVDLVILREVKENSRAW